MKGLKALVAVLVATGMLAVAVPASAGAAAYRHYVGCGISRNAKPSHVCPREGQEGRVLQSQGIEGRENPYTYYTVCVRFPSGKSLCAHSQKAKRGTLYVNKITSTIPGKHRVTWFVKGKKVGSFVFRVKS